MIFPKASRVAESVDRRWVVGAPVGVDVVAEPDAGSDTALPPLVRHGGRGFNGRWVVMHRGERRRSNRTTDPRRELLTRSGCRDADRPGAICHHRCFFGFWVAVLSSGFRQNSRPARLSFSRQISQDYKTIRTRPRFDPTLDLPVRRLTERGPRVKYLSVKKIQEAGPPAVTPRSADTARDGAPESRTGYPVAFAEPFAEPRGAEAGARHSLPAHL